MREFSGVVLVADDEPNVLFSLRAIMEDLGFDVVSAEDGERALEQYEAYAAEIALVMLDQTMPKVSGIAASLRIRERNSDVPILITSGYDDADTRADLENLGKIGFILKPYRIAQLQTKLEELL